jgi:hypothetical protein
MHPHCTKQHLSNRSRNREFSKYKILIGTPHDQSARLSLQKSVGIAAIMAYADTIVSGAERAGSKKGLKLTMQ